MKNIILTITFLFCTTFLFGQSRTVKMIIDSNKIYLNYFYKHYKSDCTLNDTVYFICRKINIDSFYLDKFVNKKKVWTKKFRTELAKDKLNLTTRTTQNGKSVFIKTKETYYNSLEL
jgi:hypothetical protein